MIVHYVKIVNLEIAACDPFHQIGADITGDDMPARPDAVREPL